MDERLQRYKNKRVLVTGHTGFKGAWLSLWLHTLGCEVIGYSLPPDVEPNLFELMSLESSITHIEGELRDYNSVRKCIETYKPEIVFHLAAQPLVLESYAFPRETFDINAGGTVNVLEAIRTTTCVKSAVFVTTDKCYENKSWIYGYRENDPLGGNDPYSSSKSMAELAIASYRESFFKDGGNTACKIASVRAGNIVGGGDFSAHRIIPDAVKALMEGVEIQVRNPASARPWLYVLDALYGYLCLGAELLTDEGFAESWNLGPRENRGITVCELVDKAIALWGAGTWSKPTILQPKEMNLLRLNWDKAAARLNWAPKYDWEGALSETIDWYKAYAEHVKGNEHVGMKEFCLGQIAAYESGVKDVVYTA